MTFEIHADARLYSSRQSMLRCIYPWPSSAVIAEIGVAYGDFSRILIDTLQPNTFHAIDTFDLHTYNTMWGANINDTLQGRNHLAYYEEKIPEAAYHQGSSWRMMELDFDDDSLDFAYLDADHSYEAVSLDLEQLQRVIKPGGHIMFDDYTNWDPIVGEPYGVLRAVNEFLEDQQWPIVGMSLEYNGFHNLLIRKPT